MKIIGVTGPSGSGKTALTEYFSSLGVPTINADELYHSMLIPPSECLDAIRDAFGAEVFSADGSLNRTSLSAIVFNDSKKLALLNSTVLKIVIAEIKKQLRKLENSGEKAVIIDAPTLIESGLHNDCNTVISVISPKEQRIERISLRDGITHNRAQERVKAQKEDQFYISHSDYVLTNDTDKESFLQKIKELGVTLGLTDFTQK